MSDGRSTRNKSTYSYKDLSGKRFGLLVAQKVIGVNKYGNKLWLCQCDCGNTKVYSSGKLVSGRASNCGCATTKLKSIAASKHGITAGGKPRTLIIWSGMKARCYNVNATSYKSYGGRGIKICKEWLGVEGFKNFHEWAITHGYDDDLEIDRIDNDGDYCPENCHWIPIHDNRIKQRRTRYFTVYGVKLNISQWCRELKISKKTAYDKLNKNENDFVTLLEKRILGKGQTFFVNKYLSELKN